VGLTNLNDESILRLYDSIRGEVELDREYRHKLVSGQSVKQYASALREEITKRRLQHHPIEWPSDPMQIESAKWADSPLADPKA
jgi:hypothetical protein